MFSGVGVKMTLVPSFHDAIGHGHRHTIYAFIKSDNLRIYSGEWAWFFITIFFGKLHTIDCMCPSVVVKQCLSSVLD